MKNQGDNQLVPISPGQWPINGVCGGGGCT